MPKRTTLGEHLDGERFWSDLMDQARIGALAGGGLRRLTLGEADNRARLWLMEKGEALDCSAHYDALGNVFLRREGQNPSLPPLLIGSHLDSQPSAGVYDGALGVVAGLAVLRTLSEQQVAHQRPVEVVSWTNEEGARFAPGASGSSWFAGRRDAETILAAQDDDGIAFKEALTECLALLDAHGAHFRSTSVVPHTFLELHIEQGPVLEAQGAPACVVTGIQGVYWYEVEVNGQANHAGTTPEASRHDAFMGAHALIGALKAAVAAHDDQVRFTIGKFALAPNSVNTIAQQARFTIDLRHPDPAVLDALDGAFRQLAKREWSSCTVHLEATSRVAPVAFDEHLIDALDEAVKAYCPQAPKLVSGAFHDAIHLAHLCPTAMLFTACRAGISHHPDEHIERGDADVAVRALAHAAGQLLTTRKD
ncbi:M20 family metallo-hydrolase [Aidingimonas halophila]|uniref:N-carbamoyl-L-amino-acid hydrolase n=1 Tax=Aidingimonas halophila TaxID=574349 RepID=A0A1H3CNF1_9GAMM|nr:M20 family metallo-hydrolase [Aidingimonas halophila]GHC35141.1 Zn-dependent hydrolase [Aidingimonas halophila]SDX55782.1 N-carbamoyl-L-amino-acid hydrolase [Aidingimonas halophila]